MPVDVISILDGSSKGVAAHVLRAATSIVEPAYAGIMRARNWSFDRAVKKSNDLGRPTISVGNITTGGTGKTPVVCWLASGLREIGQRPAVLMRGYHADAAGSDEQRELDRALNGDPDLSIPVHADASRVRGAASVLGDRPDVSVFILDDGFQHRAARRNFDLVLINATSPFGFGHVLPRGLLREPMAGLQRASAILVTHQSQVSTDALTNLLKTIAQYTDAPVFRSDHALTGLWQPSNGKMRPMTALAEGRPLVVAGIGSPLSFQRSLQQHAGHELPTRWFADHHRYTELDWEGVLATARSNGCDRIVTTEKDWSKLSLLQTAGLPVEVARLSIQFVDNDESLLLANIRQAIEASPPST